MQLDFFDIDTTPTVMEVTKISWSPSKIGTLKQCPRKFYYQYYGSKQSKAKFDENKERLRYLVALSNKSLVAGEIIHSVIATYFRKAKKGDPWTADRLTSFAISMLRASIQYSKDERAGIHNIHQYPPALLKEVFYGTMNDQEVFDEIAERLKISLGNFSDSELFTHLRQNGKREDSIIEGKCVYTLPDNIKIDGVIDIAFDYGDKFWIADWKTGKADQEETSLQLLSYALWATKQKGISKEAVVIEKAYLLDNKLETLEYSDEQLVRAKVRIIQDVDILRELHDFGIDGNFGAFTKCQQQRVCDLCPFQEVCEKSK
ncbi:MAG: PD-(D/E)XK nuclease family protein [Cyclobacteriaceae bacterium]|nr:PD-(D/E)XK nuclease family protein [Cyclobacteriaceae bacterium]